MSNINDDFDDDNFDEDADAILVDESKTKPLEKRLKIDALLEEQRLNKLKRALEDGDDFTEFDDLDDDLDDDFKL